MNTRQAVMAFLGRAASSTAEHTLNVPLGVGMHMLRALRIQVKDTEREL